MPKLFTSTTGKCCPSQGIAIFRLSILRLWPVDTLLSVISLRFLVIFSLSNNPMLFFLTCQFVVLVGHPVSRKRATWPVFFYFNFDMLFKLTSVCHLILLSLWFFFSFGTLSRSLIANGTGWDRSHGLHALSRVWQHAELSDALSRDPSAI